MEGLKESKYIFLFLLLSIGNVSAVEYSYTLFATTFYNDNFNPNLEDPSGYSLNSGASFRINTDQNSDWILDVSGVYAKEFFSIDDLSTQNANQLAFDLNYDASGSNFGLLVRDDFSQTPQNRTATQGVNNLTDVNVVTIRPDYFFDLSSVDKLFFEVSYINSDREDQSDIIADGLSFDAETKIKLVRLEHKINETNEISLITSETDNDFESDTGASSVDFIQQDAYFRWVGQGLYNQIQIEYGLSEIEDEFGRDFDTDLFNVIYSRQINRTDEFEASYRKGFNVRISDNSIDDSVDISDQSFGSAQELTSANLSYIVNGTFVDITFNAFDLEFSGTGDDREELRKGFDLSISYSLARVFLTAIDTNLEFSFRQSENTFISNDNSTINTENKTTELRYNYVHSPTLTYFASLNVRKTDTNNPNNQLNGGDSRIIGIGFIYSPRSIVQN